MKTMAELRGFVLFHVFYEKKMIRNLDSTELLLMTFSCCILKWLVKINSCSLPYIMRNGT